MDVARKFLQMGWTRSLRYAKYKGGNKNRPLEEPDAEKLKCAATFKGFYDRARSDDKYIEMKKKHRENKVEKKRP